MKAKDRLNDLRRLDGGALTEELAKLKKEQFNLRFQKASGQLDNTSRVRAVRRDIARIQTLQRATAAASAPKA